MSTPKTDVQLRKDALILRAALERLEFARATQDLQRRFAMPAVLRSLVGQFAGAGVWPVILKLFQRYPVVGSALSMVASRVIPRNARSVLRALGYAVVVWQAIRLVRAWRPSRAGSSHTRLRN